MCGFKEHACVECDAGTVELFHMVSEKVRGCLLSRAVVRDFDRGATICLQGEPARTLKIVLSGWIKLYRVSENGSEAVLTTLKKGQSFDELPALRNGECRASAEAISDCKVMFLDIGTICSCENAYREINEAVIRVTSDHMDSMIAQIEGLKVKTSVQRLSDYLVELSAAQGSTPVLNLPYGKVVLAGKLGMTPESLSRAFRKLKSVGVESDLRRVHIGDLNALRQVG